MIGFLRPEALWLLLLLPVLLLFYILRAQHRRVELPSVRFWRDASSDLEGRPSWRMPLRNPLLVFQLIFLALVVLALARAGPIGEPRRQIVLILDSSVTMGATDIAPSRFAEGKRQTGELLAALRPQDELSLILAGSSPTVVGSASGDEKESLERSLPGLAPSGATASLDEALVLASSLFSQKKYDEMDGRWRKELIVVTDGRALVGASDGAAPIWTDESLAALGLGGVAVETHLVGQSARNVSLTGLALRPSLQSVGPSVGPSGGQPAGGPSAFCRVTNHSDEEADLPFVALADGIPVESRRLHLPPGGAVELTFRLPSGTRMVEAKIDPADELAIDNVAVAFAPDSRSLNVALVSNNPLPWERLFRAMPEVKLAKVRVSAYRPSTADVTIFDGFQPPRSSLPPGGMLFVNPAPGRLSQTSVTLPISGETGPVGVVWRDEQSALLTGVDFGSLYLPKSYRLTLPSWGRLVAESPQGPLIFEGILDGRRTAVFAFDLMASDLPRRLAFPILVSNTLAALSPRLPDTTVEPGEAVEAPIPPGVSELIVRRPDGSSQTLAARGTSLLLASTDLPGAYTLVGRGPRAEGRAEGAPGPSISTQSLAVGLKNPAKLDIRPVADPLGGQRLAVGGEAVLTQTVSSEVWSYLAALALSLLAAEWWYYCRRG